MDYHKIIIVGENNLFRSFMAEVILRGVLKRRNISDIEVKSRGLVVLFSEPVSQMALGILRQNGYDIKEYRSAPLEEEELEASDLVLTMTDAQAEKVRKDYKAQPPCMSVGTFIGLEDEVPDINVETPEDFEKSFHTLESFMEAAADRLIGDLL